MIKIEDYNILVKNILSLKEISKDNHDGIIYYMTESTSPAVDFDAVKDRYVAEKALKQMPKSVDAIFIDSFGKQTFIEFKNGYIGKKEQYEIIQKVYDSLLIYTDLICKGIKYTREHMDFILVYNDQKNNQEDKKDPKTKVRNAKSRDDISKKISKLGGTSHIKYGLEIFKKYCFRDVYTYNESEFEKYIKMDNEQK